MAPDSPHGNARTDSRRRVLKAGVIAYSGRQVTLRCSIKDLSDSGARLHVEGSIAAPDTFELLGELDGMEVACQVMWRRGMQVGVRFTEPPRFNEKKRKQIVDQWILTHAKPTLRRQPKVPA